MEKKNHVYAYLTRKPVRTFYCFTVMTENYRFFLRGNNFYCSFWFGAVNFVPMYVIYVRM